MKSVTVDLAVDTVSFLQLSTCDRYMLRLLIRLATTGPDV